MFIFMEGLLAKKIKIVFLISMLKHLIQELFPPDVVEKKGTRELNILGQFGNLYPWQQIIIKWRISCSVTMVTYLFISCFRGRVDLLKMNTEMESLVSLMGSGSDSCEEVAPLLTRDAGKMLLRLK